MKDARSARLFREVLRLLPASLRSRHGGEMEDLLLEQLRQSQTRRARFVVWLQAFADVLREAVRSRMRRRDARPRADRARGVAATGPSNAVHVAARWNRRSSSWREELRQAVRSVWRRPALSLLVIGMLALGVMSNVAVFTLVEAVFLRPFPFPSPDRLVYLNETAPRWNLEYVGINYPDFARWREDARLFEAMTVLDVGSFNLSEGGSTERVTAQVATHDFPRVLGVEPVLGRFITAEEDVPDGPRVVVLTWGLWQRRFGGARDVLDRSLRLDGEEYSIVGVLPREAEFPGEFDIWLPLGGDPAQSFQNYGGEGIGRLREGVTVKAAHLDLERVQQAIWQERDEERIVSPLVRPLHSQFVGDLRPIALALGGAVALVLLVACANIASLLLARAATRRREVGVRIALGAARSQLLRQFFAESVVVSLMAGAIGTAGGIAAARLLATALPDQLPSWVHVTFNWPIALFAVAIALLTSLLFGWAPIGQMFRADARSLLKDSARTTLAPGNRRTLNTLVVLEVALAAVLLVSGSLMIRAFLHLQSADPGFRTENVLHFSVALPNSTYPDSAQRFAFYRDLMDRLHAIPGVENAGVITCPPLMCHWGRFYDVEGAPQRGPDDPDPVVLFRFASPGYADAMGVRLRSGRFLSDADSREHAARVAVVNETFARTFWPGESEIVGRRLRGRIDSVWTTVVGLTADVRHYGMEEPMRPGVYLPIPSGFWNGVVSVLVHAPTGATSLANHARSVIRQLDPELAVFSMETMQQTFDRSLTLRRTYSALLALFGLMALLLAVGGIYGVISYIVAQRTHEIGIRLALGAQRRSVLGMVMRQSVGLVSIGLVLGFLASLAAGRVIQSLLAGVAAQDAPTYGLVAVLLLSGGVAAALIPARRAVAVDPMRTLRQE